MKRIILALLACSMLWSTQAMAADMKLGYVDIKAAMENTKAYKQGLKRLEALQKKKKKQLKSMRNKVAALDKELQMQQMTMSNAHQAEKEQEFVRLKKEFDRELQDASDQLKREKRQLDQRMFGKLYEALRSYGKTKGFDLILPKSATIYASASHDVTAEITKILDSK